MIIYLCFRLAAVLYGCLQGYAPTNRVIAWLGTPSGIKWAIPTALVAVPGYLFAASLCRVIIDDGGPEYLYLLVTLFVWNAIKFGALAVRAPVVLLVLLGRRTESLTPPRS